METTKFLQTATFACIFLLASLSGIWAQTEPPTHAAGLAEYAETPVDMYTGTGGISIMLASASGKELSLPISVSYHGDGLKVGETASMLGLGWSLNAGGMITRTIHGKPDEENYFNREYSDNGIYGITLFNPLTNKDHFDLLYSVLQGDIDTEPDVFYYSIGGNTGKFYFTREGEPVLESYSGMKILTDRELSHFTLVDETGIRYGFGVKEKQGVSKSYENGNWVLLDQNTPSGATSVWYLDSITSPTGEQITLEYESFELNEITKQEGNTILMFSGSPKLFSTNKCIKSTTADSKRIKKIFFQGGYITFTYGGMDEVQSPKQLDMLAVFSWNGTSASRLVNRVFLAYDAHDCLIIPGYEMDQESALKLRKKRMLKEIYSKNNEQEKSPSYIFEYQGGMLPLPSYLSEGQDHWGYYNGKEIITLNQEINRESDFNFAKRGALVKITYPSGSSANFDYEPHQDAEGVVKSGGLRIREIVVKDESGNTVSKKNYVYGGMFVYPKPVYSYELYKVLTDDLIAPSSYLTTFNNTKLGVGAGKAVYREVTEIIGETGGSLKYKNVYKYNFDIRWDVTNTASGLLLTPPHHSEAQLAANIYYRPFMEHPFPLMFAEHPLNGTLAMYSNYGYDAASESYYKIRETGSKYMYESVRNKKSIPYLKAGYKILASQNYYELPPADMFDVSGTRTVLLRFGIPPFLVYRSNVNFFWTHLEETFERIYPDKEDPARFIETSTRYTYADHGQLARIESTNSEQEKTIRKFKYAMDYSDQSGFIFEMKSKNVLSQPIEEQVWLQKLGETSPKLMGGRLTAYHPDFFKPVKIWATELGTPIAGFDQEGLFMSDSQRYLPKTTYNYDGDGNILSQDMFESGQTKSYYWNKDRRYLLAEASLAKPEQIFHTSFEEEEGADILTGNAKTGKKSKTGGYEKTLGNLPEGTYTLSYWQKENNQWILKTRDGSPSNTGTFLIELEGEVDEIRFHPKNALMSTFTFEEGVGTTSQTNAGHQTSYYEYDSFNRIVLIRDENRNILQKYDYQILNR